MQAPLTTHRTQAALREISYIRSRPKPPRKRMRFDSDPLDFRGVDDRRDWYSPEHATPQGQALADLFGLTGAGLLFNGGKTLGKKVRGIF